MDMRRNFKLIYFWVLVCLVHLGPGVLLELWELHSHSVGMVVSRNILIKKIHVK